MLQLISDFPWWAWILCFLAGAVYATSLYARDQKLAFEWKPLRWILPALRFTGVSILAILLLEPYLRTAFNEEVKPIAVILQDNSASVGKQMTDTVAYLNQLETWKASISQKYDVRSYTFGNTLTADGSVDFQEPATDMSAALLAVNQLYRYTNIGALIIAGDGIYNTGENPIYSSLDFDAPVHSIALGDTTRQLDLRVVRAISNKVAFTGDRLNVHVEADATLAQGNTMQISLLELQGNATRSLGSMALPVTSQRFQATHDFIIQTDQPGIHQYRVLIKTLQGELNKTNNQYDLFVEVLDARQKILLLADAPHPDIAALKAAIENNKNYDLTVRFAKEYASDWRDYSLVILHKLPNASATGKLIADNLSAASVPVWIITGEEPSVAELNKMQQLLRLSGGTGKGDETTASGNAGFNLFVMEEEKMKTIERFPPLLSPYGDYTLSANAQVLFYQKLGAVSTRQPLMSFSQPGGRKMAMICGENLWKWRMHDFLLNNNHKTFDELVSKTVQYLATKDDQKQFRVSVAKNVFTDNEKVWLDAELYNESFELINSSEASCIIKNAEGKEYPYTFSKSGKRYILDAGYLPTGTYTVQGKTSYNNKELRDNAAFHVVAVQLETAITVADHNLMNRLATDHGGYMFYSNQLDVLADTLLQSVYAKPTLNEKIETRSVINLVWILLLIVTLVSVEWFIRKWSGGY